MLHLFLEEVDCVTVTECAFEGTFDNNKFSSERLRRAQTWSMGEERHGARGFVAIGGQGPPPCQLATLPDLPLESNS